MLSNRGFTLLELLVVIAIIGLLASISLAFLNPSREKSRNAAMLSQMYEYKKALDLYYSENGRYPSGFSSNSPNFRGRLYCIGDEYTSGPCFHAISMTVNVASEVETVLAPTHISRIAHISQGVDSGGTTLSSPAYRGCSRLETGSVTNLNSVNVSNPATYPDCTDQNFSLFFALEGTNQDCGRAHRVSTNYAGRGFTLCQISSAQ